MIRDLAKWFMKLSKLGKTAAVVTSVVGLSMVSSAIGPDQKATTANLTTTNTSSVKGDMTKNVVVTHKTETTTEPVPYTTTSVNTATLDKGLTKTQTAGVNGVRTHTFDVTLTNGIETSRSEISNELTTQPTNEVIQIGTYVAPSCPNGTYVNTYGNTVCSPYESPGAPAGATARCVDGSYSFSQSRSGTCSHHGGVSAWL